MKKKVIIGVVAAVVAIAIAVMLVFVFSGKNAENAFDLSGVWKVAANVNDGVVAIPQNEYMVFSHEEASDYRDGNTEPYVTSSYRSAGDVLELQTSQELIILLSRQRVTFHYTQTTPHL